MNRHFRWASAALFCVAAMTAAPGCNSENNVTVTGKLLKGGVPFTANRDTRVTVTFVADVEEAPHTKQVKYNRETGAYTVELPAGSYRVTYVIAEEGQSPVSASEEFREKVHNLSKSQELDLEIK